MRNKRLDENAKQRLAGVAVVVVLAVIFAPLFLESTPHQGGLSDSGLGAPIYIPPAPDTAPSLDTGAPAESATPSVLPGPITATPSARRPLEPVAVAVSTLPAGPLPAPATGPSRVPSNTVSWVVQVVSVSSPAAAETRQNELRQRGYPAFIETIDVNGTRYYRVRVGPELDRAQADRMAADLKVGSPDQPLVQRYR